MYEDAVAFAEEDDSYFSEDENVTDGDVADVVDDTIEHNKYKWVEFNYQHLLLFVNTLYLKSVFLQSTLYVFFELSMYLNSHFLLAIFWPKRKNYNFN